jgi:purine-binding chemotaxis protein CheW
VVRVQAVRIGEREMPAENVKKREARQILVFLSANQEFGLDISCVREVLRPQQICPLPKTPSFIDGVIHLRGRIVALVDLGKRLHPHQAGGEPNSRIIVCKGKSFIIGLRVNALREIIALSEDEIEATPAVVSMHLEADLISGIAKVGERIIPILDLGRLLTKQEVTELSTLQP